MKVVVECIRREGLWRILLPACQMDTTQHNIGEKEQPNHIDKIHWRFITSALLFGAATTCLSIRLLYHLCTGAGKVVLMIFYSFVAQQSE